MRRRSIILLTMPWLILVTVSAASALPKGTPNLAVLKGVSASAPASGNELLLRIEGDYAFNAIPVSEGAVFIDLKGARVSGVPKDGRWTGRLLAGYHLVEYTAADHQPVVRVQVELKHPEAFQVQKESGGLRVVFGSAASSSTQRTAAPPVTPVATVPATAGTSRGRPGLSVTAITGISIRPGAGGETVIDVHTKGPALYRAFHLEDPARVVVDFERTRYLGRLRDYPAHSSELKGVRVGYPNVLRPPAIRVVADLVGEPEFLVKAQPNGVRIQLKSHRQAPQIGAGHGPAAPGLPLTTSPGKGAHLAAQGSSPVIPSVQKSPSSSPPQMQPAVVKIAVTQPEMQQATPTNVQAVLPGSLSSHEAAATPRKELPRETPEALRAAQAAKILTGEVNPPLDAAQSQTPATAAAPQEKPKYTGEPISVNLKDVDLKDFFRLIHEISGLNIIIDPDVQGKVTLVLDGVPWDQALDIVLKNNRLDKTLEGNVLRIARVETLSAEQEALKRLAEAREEAQPLVTVFRPINYAKASTISTMLKSWVGGGALTKRGNVLVDDRTNTLIISDIQTQIPVIESIITKLDRKAKQVSIEARVVLASSTFSRSLTTVLAGATKNASGSTNVAGATGTGVSAAALTPPIITTATAGGFGVFAISNASSRYAIDAAIGAAETKSLARTISRPSIVTQNNVPGSVQQGTQIPIQTTINNTISIQYVAATLSLSVTPQVTEDGNVFLVITVQNASPGLVLTGAGPSINTQSATTQVLVPDGGMVVFGGVTVTSRSKNATYVPLIGSIPIVGHLFKSSSVSDSDSELLFFVSPKVLAG